MLIVCQRQSGFEVRGGGRFVPAFSPDTTVSPPPPSRISGLLHLVLSENCCLLSEQGRLLHCGNERAQVREARASPAGFPVRSRLLASWPTGVRQAICIYFSGRDGFAT